MSMPSGAPKLTTIPDGNLAIVPLDSMAEFAKGIDAYITSWRSERVKDNPSLLTRSDGYLRDSYIIESKTPRFGSGEAKGTVAGTIRGDDVFLLVDVCNYSITYKISKYENVKSPDDHFQDLKRVIAAVSGGAKRINVIMPYLYEGRQMLRARRDSLDCAHALQELEEMGVETIITFDPHDARVQNSIPLRGFEAMKCVYQFTKSILRAEPSLVVDKDHLMVISPDEGGISRAIYMATMLGVDMGTFYKRHESGTSGDSSDAHEFLGRDVSGKDMIILDDMISSGGKVLMTAKLLKKRGANRIYICATFGMFTKGLDEFDKAYKNGTFTKLITTNLVYQMPQILSRDYYISCDMRKFLALIIDTLNHDGSLSTLLDPVDRIQRVLARHAAGEAI